MPPFPDPTPPVSVVIPAYNREATIAEAARSVLRQSFRDFELIVVDDASTDGTAAAVETIDDPRLRLVRRDRNGGAAAARNTGIAEARGTWVAFQDSDDEWLPRKLEMQFAALERHPGAVGVYCGMIIVGRLQEKGRDPAALEYRPPSLPGVPLEGELYLPLLRSGSLISTQTLMARRETLLSIGGFDESLPALEDWDCSIRIAGLGPIAFEPEPLVLQRFSDNSLTRNHRKYADGLAGIIEKNAAEFAGMPRAHAAHLYRLAGQYWSLGLHPQALRTYRAAFSRSPASPRFWPGLLRALLMAAVPRRLWLRRPRPD